MNIWKQNTINLKAKSRGFHLITKEIERHLEIDNIQIGLLNLFIQHTSASLTINENFDPDVRHDFEAHSNKMIPENAPYYRHTLEGSDDMPAHLKSSIFGASLSIPITDGQLNLGSWQGIYLGEHRNHAGSRTVIATIQGSSLPQ